MTFWSDHRGIIGFRDISAPDKLGPAKLVRGRVCGGRVGQGPSWLGAELVRGRDVQLPIIYVYKLFECTN